ARENGENPRAQRAPRIQRAALTGRLVESRSLAVDIQRSALSRLRRSGYRVLSNGVKSGPFFVLGTTQMPAILAEIGYCTNAQEALLLADPAYRQAIAEGLAEGVLAYRDRRLSRISAERRPLSRTRRAVR
ncbi:MAG: N-acetylmuramoyl-L-alanine amidase, partial [Desulfovibrio sp.]|nr:N-acetylmuramoyl-L-alanine amidase [Desulfovibrio sp.]